MYVHKAFDDEEAGASGGEPWKEEAAAFVRRHYWGEFRSLGEVQVAEEEVECCAYDEEDKTGHVLSSPKLLFLQVPVPPSKFDSPLPQRQRVPLSLILRQPREDPNHHYPRDDDVWE